MEEHKLYTYGVEKYKDEIFKVDGTTRTFRTRRISYIDPIPKEYAELFIGKERLEEGILGMEGQQMIFHYSENYPTQLETISQQQPYSLLVVKKHLLVTGDK